MYRIYLFLVTLAFGVAPVTTCLAQTDTTRTARTILKISPLHLLMNQVVLEVEKSVSADGRHSLVLSPSYHTGSTAFADSWSKRARTEQQQEAKVAGYGAELQHRMYFKTSSPALPGKPYLSYGLQYNRYSIRFEEAAWVEELEGDGLYYYRNRMLPFTESVDRWGASTLLGFQGPFLSNFIIADMYIGLGYDYSKSKSDFTAIRYNTSVFDYGYSGIRPIVGAKFGIAF